MISLLHPSRGRPQKARETLHKWWGSYSHGIDFRYYLSLDTNDPLLPEYFNVFEPYINITVNHNKSVVDATNIAASKAKGDIFIYMSDDFDCPDGWVDLIEKEFSAARGPMLLKVDDCLQKFDVPVLTIPIMNRNLYEKLGYFWHPYYKSMFVDEDLYWTCKNNNWIRYAPHLKFTHNHVSVGKADNDETYKRSAANWDQGKATFARRKAAGFPL
jgi:glycosyltransferase involved in cell wall biosynthesis